LSHIPAQVWALLFWLRFDVLVMFNGEREVVGREAAAKPPVHFTAQRHLRPNAAGGEQPQHLARRHQLPREHHNFMVDVDKIENNSKRERIK
jgi:hypothetical protein